MSLGGRWRSPEPRAFAAAGRAWRISLTSIGWVACHWHHGQAARHHMCIAAHHRACITARRHVTSHAILNRSCPRVPRHGTGSAEQRQQQRRERRGYPLRCPTQRPGGKRPTEDFPGLQHLHGPIRASAGGGQPGPEPLSRSTGQPPAHKGEWDKSDTGSGTRALSGG